MSSVETNWHQFTGIHQSGRGITHPGPRETCISVDCLPVTDRLEVNRLRAILGRVSALADGWQGGEHDCHDFTARCDDACQFARELRVALGDVSSE